MSDDIADTIDWDDDRTSYDGGGAPGWYAPDAIPASFESTSILSTCSGCGMRVATETLMGSGRPGAVWVIVFLSDGAHQPERHPRHVPLTFHQISSTVSAARPRMTLPRLYFWSSYCIDRTAGTLGRALLHRR